MKTCKYCGTTNKEDFIYPSGSVMKKVCVSCYSHNLSESTKNRIYIRTDNDKLKQVNSQFGINYYKEKHSFFCKIEEIRENPNFQFGESTIQVRCKQCKNWFTPTNNQLTGRIRALEHPKGRDGLFFYCSDDCKSICPSYNIQEDPYKHTEKFYTSYEYEVFKKEVLIRQYDELNYNECELCGYRDDLEVHHKKPKKTHPHLILDPDNGIILCNICHTKKNAC